MTNAKHTPAPWKLNRDIVEIGNCTYAIIGEGNYYVAAVSNENYEPQNEANAHLIAAAPELLDVVIRILHLCDTSDLLFTMPKEEQDDMRAAIAKAKGE